MIPFPENPNHPLSNKNKREGFWAGCTATRQLAHDLEYRKVPSVEKLKEWLDENVFSDTSEIWKERYAEQLHAMLMKEEKDA